MTTTDTQREKKSVNTKQPLRTIVVWHSRIQGPVINTVTLEPSLVSNHVCYAPRSTFVHNFYITYRLHYLKLTSTRTHTHRFVNTQMIRELVGQLSLIPCQNHLRGRPILCSDSLHHLQFILRLFQHTCKNLSTTMYSALNEHYGFTLYIFISCLLTT